LENFRFFIGSKMQNNESNKWKQQQQNQKDVRNYQYTTPNPYSSTQYTQPPQRTYPYPVQQNGPSYIGGSTGYGQQTQKTQQLPPQNPYYNQYSNPNPYQTNYKPNPYNSEPNPYIEPKEYSKSNPYSTYSQVKPPYSRYPEDVPYKSSPMVTTQVFFLN
jgi:hypothetical protein